MRWKPTPQNRKTIRAYAKRAAEVRGGVRLEPASRFNLETGATNVNIYLISDHEDWEDTDLNDHMPWSEFAATGIDLTPDNRGIVDVYVYSLGCWGELETNIQLVIEGGKLVRLDQTAGPSLTLG
jgi:hypothetical protein